jgi:hypothetical protein
MTAGLILQMYVLLTPLTFTIVLAPDFAHAEPLEMVAA